MGIADQRCTEGKYFEDLGAKIKDIQGNQEKTERAKVKKEKDCQFK